MLEEITYYQDIRKHKVLTQEEEKIYSLQAKQGAKEAIDKMVSCNQRLVVKIALKYIGRGIDVLDLIGEGNLGLMKAITMFDPERGFRFSTYASWWIKCFVKRMIQNNSRTIRLPIHTIKKVTCYLTAIDKLTQKLQRKPTLKEIAKTLNWKIQKTAEISLLSESTIPLDGWGEDLEEDNSLYNVLASDFGLPEHEQQLSETKKIIYSCMRKLTKKEQKTILKRFGMLGDSCKSLMATGAMLGVSNEMVRKYQETAISKLKDSFDVLGLNFEDFFSV